jgi:Protein-L-isoaspartate(D-aspartate) O-methyltransferase (PCMT)
MALSTQLVDCSQLAQLKEGGRLFCPVGPDGGVQELLQIDKTPGGFQSRHLMVSHDCASRAGFGEWTSGATAAFALINCSCPHPPLYARSPRMLTWCYIKLRLAWGDLQVTAVHTRLIASQKYCIL